MELVKSDLDLFVGLTVSDAVESIEKQGLKVVVKEFFTDKQPRWDCLLVIRARQIEKTKVELVAGNFLLCPTQNL